MTDNLQQAWQEEAKKSQRRQFLIATAILFGALIIIGLFIISWPKLKATSSQWQETLTKKSQQLLEDLKQWQNDSEQQVINGNILK